MLTSSLISQWLQLTTKITLFHSNLKFLGQRLRQKTSRSGKMLAAKVMNLSALATKVGSIFLVATGA